jgi:hypothetical protein
VLTDDDKRAAYDREKSSDAHSQSSRRSGNNYTWKNPEFDPKFDHFADLPERIKNFGPHQAFPSFFSFDSSKWFREEFGSFTFDMAEEVFEKAFKDLDKK